MINFLTENMALTSKIESWRVRPQWEEKQVVKADYKNKKEEGIDKKKA